MLHNCAFLQCCKPQLTAINAKERAAENAPRGVQPESILTIRRPAAADNYARGRSCLLPFLCKRVKPIDRLCVPSRANVL